MDEDDILREIRDYREAYARRFNDDARSMLDALRVQEEAERWPVVRSVAEHQAAQAERPIERVAAEAP